MRDNVVEIKGIAYQSIDEIIIHKGVNEHGRATIRCTTDKTSMKDIVSNSDGMAWVSIMIGEDEKGSATDCIFSGVIDRITLESRDSLEKIKKITVELIDGSYLLDIKKETNTYQNNDSQISEVKRKIQENFKKNFTGVSLKLNNGKDINDSDQPECKFLVQYEETDYAFLKRCASIKNQPLISVTDKDGGMNVNLSIGLMSDGKSGSIDTKLYKEVKHMGAALLTKRRGVENVSDKDYEMIEVRSREYFPLGSKISVGGKSLYVYSSESKYGVKTNEDKANWIGADNDGERTSSVFFHIYQLAGEKRFMTPREYNEKMIGVSLDAKVSEVKEEMLKIECICDGEKPKDPKEFPYATVYTSPNGTGWYCMPEEEDKVRLYLPTEDETDAYVISAVHLEGGKGRDNPEVKFIKNKHNKEVRFDEKSITITNNDGMTIVLDDTKGISIESNNNINISGKKDVTFESKSGKLNISGNKKVTIKQGSMDSVDLENGITFKSSNIKM